MAVKKKKAKKKAVAPAKRIKTIKEPMTKTAMFSAIAETTELSKKEVVSVFEALTEIINGHIKKGGAGTCTIPGLMKVKTVRKPSSKARKGVPNPFRPGELMDVAAKPARTIVKVLALKKLKDMAG